VWVCRIKYVETENELSTENVRRRGRRKVKVRGKVRSGCDARVTQEGAPRSSCGCFHACYLDVDIVYKTTASLRFGGSFLLKLPTEILGHNYSCGCHLQWRVCHFRGLCMVHELIWTQQKRGPLLSKTDTIGRRVRTIKNILQCKICWAGMHKEKKSGPPRWALNKRPPFALD